MKLKCTGLLFTILIIFIGNLFSQDGGSKGQLLLIYQDKVKPAKVAEYEQGTKEMIALFKEKNVTSPYFNFTTIAGEEFTYSYVLPIKNFADLDQMQKTWMEFEQNIDNKEKWQAMMESGSKNIKSVHQFVVASMPDLSYKPVSPALKEEDKTFYHYDFFYVNTGKEKEFAEVAKEWSELYEKNKIPYGWNLYRVVIGQEQPLYVVSFGSKDKLDYVTTLNKIEDVIGKEKIQSLLAKTFSLVRKFEHKNATVRPDLSYSPPTDITAK